MHKPLLSDFAVRLAPVSFFVTATCAWSMTASEESVIVPVISPFVVCAGNSTPRQQVADENKHSFLNINLLLTRISILPSQIEPVYSQRFLWWQFLLGFFMPT